MNKRVLGLDPGITSIGWVLIEENEKGEAVKLIDGGSRIFKPIYEPQFLKLKNRLHGKITYFEMPKQSIFELDEKEDLKIVKKLI